MILTSQKSGEQDNYSLLTQKHHPIIRNGSIILVIILLFLTSPIQVAAKKNDQKYVTLRKTSVPIKEILKEIERQTDFRFVYNHDHVDTKMRFLSTYHWHLSTRR
jgi:hypothetical protein